MIDEPDRLAIHELAVAAQQVAADRMLFSLKSYRALRVTSSRLQSSAAPLRRRISHTFSTEFTAPFSITLILKLLLP